MERFSASVSSWSDKAMRNLELITLEGAQEVAQEATRPVAKGGLMRVDTGFLRSSMVTSLNAPTPINPKARPPDDAQKDSYQLDFDEALATFAAFDIGDVLYLCFVASYARVREQRDMFVRNAAMRWPSIIAAIAARLK